MSLKRYAIIAAVSYHNNHHNFSATTQTPLQQLQQKSVATTLGASAPNSTTAATPSLAVASNANNYNNNNNNITTGSSITPYNGGLGLFHQQNIRANGGGIGLLNGNGHSAGSSYPNTINGNVNLLLGGAMLSLVTTILCVVCYCCHRNIKKRTEAAYRQQRQWLENDPNMEIYSVEQCYETSGLFLGESTDGLATLPALHHEPPPSYDAVVAMQEQQLLHHQHQQQQLLLQQHQLQRNSPPPGYRSSLDVSAIAAAAICNRGSPDGMAISDSNANFSSSGNMFQHNKQLNGCNKTLAGGAGVNPIFNMKKVLNAQSCCSLQRAEVENMWNAAAAAVAARSQHSAVVAAAIHCDNGQATTTPTSTPTPTLMMARKSLPAYAVGAKLTVNDFGRRYLNQNYYRRGCPLCGKFRYDAEDTLSISTESGLDNAQLAGAGASTNHNGERTVCCRADVCNNDNNNCRSCNEDSAREAASAEHNYISAILEASPTEDEDDNDDDDECSCSTQRNSTTRTTPPSTTRTTQMSGETAIAATGVNSSTSTEQQDYANGNAGSQWQPQLYSEIVKRNSIDFQSMTALQTSASDDLNANSTSPTNPVISATTTTTTAIDTDFELPSTSAHVLDLDSINENGIVRLDMSKIIDKTGLPNYEAALKLESSGYV